MGAPTERRSMKTQFLEQVPPHEISHPIPGIPRNWGLFALLIAGSALLVSFENETYAAGATTPFTTLEAEAGILGGGATISAFIPGSPVPTAPTKELEASGGAYVVLDQIGQCVSWSNPVANANAIVIRASIPDAPNGGGITATIDLYVDGVFRQAITLSSKQSWNYMNSTTNPDDPKGGGTPWHFYNEDRAAIAGTPIAAGAAIKLQVDAANAAPYYDIDCIDLESVPAALPQPPNSLSVVAYGADPNFAIDSTIAIQNCINAARTTGVSVWIPPGEYLVASLASTPLDLTGVTVRGAGVWYSMLYRKVPLPPPNNQWRSYLQVGSGTTLTDVSIDSNAIYRGAAGGDDYGLLAQGAGGWLVDRVWVQHCDAQWMSGSNGTIQNCRVADSWADGINLNNGNTPDPNKAGINLTAQNNFVRGGGDDGIAVYSDSGPSGKNTEMVGARVLNNTSVAPYWANGLRLSGGKNVLVQYNLVMDPAANSGIEVSTFGVTGHPLESATVSGNVVYRGGGWNGTDRHGMHVGSPASNSDFPAAYTSAVIRDNAIYDARRTGLAIGSTYDALLISNNVISRPATKGIWVESGVTGTESLTGNTVENLNTGQPAYQNDSASTFMGTLVGNSWQNQLPQITQQPASTSVGQGQTAVFGIGAENSSARTYQWSLNGTPINGATNSYLVLNNVTSDNAGGYTCVVTNSAGSSTSASATLSMSSSGDLGRLINLSVRANAGIGSQIFSVGFVIDGLGTSGTKPLLIRATGPALVPFGVTGVLADPMLTVFQGDTSIASNAGWGGNPQITAANSAVGAFALTDPSSKDSALYLSNLTSGAYSAQITGTSGDTGTALAEIYDATPSGSYTPAAPRLTNASARIQVGVGGNVGIAGFVIGGSTSKTVLIRGSGPALVPFGVSGILPDPQLRLYSGNNLIEGNVGWSGDPQIAATASSLGAFSWGSSPTADSALLATLPPGAYSAVVSGASGDTGVALIEVYDVP